MTDGVNQVAEHWAYKYELTSAAFDTLFLPFALFSQTFSSCSLALARFLSFLSFGLKTRLHHVWGKMTEEVKLTEETKLFEEKKVADPYIVGFIESMEKQIQKKLLTRSWRVYPKILMIEIVMMWKVGMKTLRIGRGAQAILSSKNRLSSKVMLMP
jgi:hypothetical protein